MASKMIEAAARAIQEIHAPYDPFDEISEEGREEYRRIARAAFRAALEAMFEAE